MIPYGRHAIDDGDIARVVEVLKGGWLTCGPHVESFERALCQQTGAAFAVSCSNGTTALHLAFLALGIGPGDTVLVPAITFLASANAARYVGADVVFVDVDPSTGLMTAQTLEHALDQHKGRTFKAVVNVHLAGQCEHLEEIARVARAHGLLIIEDAAHAIGTHYIAKDGTSYPIGANAFSDLTTFSFHPVKTVAMGEGGAITTQCEKVAATLRNLRTHGMVRDPNLWVDPQAPKGPWYYEMQDLGYNYRISDINCALGESQLAKLDAFKAARQACVESYDTRFDGMPHLMPLRKLALSHTSWHLYVLFIDFAALGITRTEVMDGLRTRGIGTQVHYIPVNQQPYYTHLYGTCDLPGAQAYYERCLSLPLFVGLTPDQQTTVVEALADICVQK